MQKFKKSIKAVSKLSLYSFYEKLKNKKTERKRFANQKKRIGEYLQISDVPKLQIGAGSNLLKGWLNTDINDNIPDVVFMDAGNKFPIATKSFQYVYSEHLFEHLTIEQQLNLLMECYRILKKGGVLRIATPDLKFLINLYQNKDFVDFHKYCKWAMNHSAVLRNTKAILGENKNESIYVINNFFKAWGHQLIHDYSSIQALGKKVGFKKIYQEKVGYSEFESLNNVEKHGTIIPEEMNDLETMVIEFLKI